MIIWSGPPWSPNHGSRKGAVVDTVLLHGTGGGTFESNRLWLLAPSSGVSAHYLVGRAGEIAKLVPVQKAAWHAGRSTHPKPIAGVSVNQRSVGIELVHPNAASVPWPEVQLEALQWLLGELRAAVPTITWLLGHRHVAPKRKPFCPTGLEIDWLAQRMGWHGPKDI